MGKLFTDMLRIQKLAQPIDEDSLGIIFNQVKARMVVRHKFAKNLVEQQNTLSDENFQHILNCINRSDEEIKFLLGIKLG